MFHHLKKCHKKSVSFLNSLRFIHRNHPGHRKKPLAIKPKLDLPDRYLTEAIYPPVKPKLPPGKWSDKIEPKLAWKYFEEEQKFHSIKTIEERLSILAYSNIQQTLDDMKLKGTRWRPIHLISSLSKTPRMLPFNQYITKTDIKSTNDLPLITSGPISNEKEVELNKSVDSDLFEKVKQQVKENILIYFAKQKELKSAHVTPLHTDTYKPDVLELEKNNNDQIEEGNLIIKTIMNTCVSILSTSKSNDHLLKAQYGSNVNVKAYWKRCGFKEQNPRGTDKNNKDLISFQYNDIAAYQIKCDMPLRPVRHLY